jgi:hypothetical protein
MSYQGAVTKGSLSGITAHVETATDKAVFIPSPTCAPAKGEQCRNWSMPSVVMIGVFDQTLNSALAQADAKLSPHNQAANLVIKTMIVPAPGHRQLIGEHYRMGKTMAMALIPFEHSRYYTQHAHFVDKIEMTFHGVSQTFDVRLSQDAGYKASMLSASDQAVQDVKLYRDLQNKAVAEIVKRVEAAASQHS